MKDTTPPPTTTHYDVIIAGAGPVGLFLACELALAHCSVLILEKQQELSSPIKRFPFGIRGLSTPSVEALYRRNLLDELEVPKRLKDPHKIFVKGPKRQVGHFAGIPFYESDIDTTQWGHRVAGSTDTHLMAEMEELETVFTRRALSLGVTMVRGAAISGLSQSADAVTVQAGSSSYTGRWLVGCDGSRSVVRKAARFEFAGTEPAFTGYSAKVTIADPEQLLPGRNLTPGGMYLQSQPGYLNMLEFDGGAAHQGDQPLTLEQVQAVLRRVSGTDVTLTELHMATTWTDRARQATHYRNGRILLAGDAAHIHSPLGGQGLNLGLGDAMNLGWKLAATLQGRAPEGLLDSYEAERYPLGAQVLDWSRAQVAIMRPTPEARALNAIIRDLMQTRDGATYMAGRVWGIHTHYDLGAGHPLVGRSVPNFSFADSTTIGERLRPGKALLLDVAGSDSLATWAAGYGGQIDYITGGIQDAVAISAVLIRPDGIVAWATDGAVDLNELQQAADRWLVKRA
ncbi:FAD-dependent monooxygenase [Paraflavitalea pollutisoli]|uniref:FAD-dependent monooxygenase n=1 Tax=Paraflavitalea pollutisoli TaxID=3034143 RepID=UPI0023EB2174|nr:FAD-dependent monooxygenase [Paraflavitalea sp. H1-2-19X]